MTQQFGKTDDELATMPLTFRDGLFAGAVVLVSGAGRGIGKAIAFQFARLGAKLALCGRDAARLDAVAAALSGLGAEVLVHPMSIRDSDAVVRLFDAAGERFGTVDVLVNNAGGQFPQAAIDFSAKGWNAVIDTNLNGTWYMMQQAARRWRDAGRGGRIVNIVAVTSRGMPGVAHTCAARAGVVYLSKTVAIEWAPLGIQINCVAPGAIATEGMNVYSEEARRTLPNTNRMRRFGDVRDIADAVCYLAGPSGAFITGEVLVVDGGNQIWGDQWTIPRPDWFNTVT
jgi:citronellol/citronellal dehydrogenase